MCNLSHAVCGEEGGGRMLTRRNEHKVGSRCPTVSSSRLHTCEGQLGDAAPHQTLRTRLHAMLSHDYLLPWWSVLVTKLDAAAATCLPHTSPPFVSCFKPPYDHHHCNTSCDYH